MDSFHNFEGRIPSELTEIIHFLNYGEDSLASIETALQDLTAESNPLQSDDNDDASVNDDESFNNDALAAINIQLEVLSALRELQTGRGGDDGDGGAASSQPPAVAPTDGPSSDAPPGGCGDAAPSSSSAPPGPPNDENVIRRDLFNNIEIREMLHVPQPANAVDYAELFSSVTGAIDSLADRVNALACAGDVVQLELRSDALQNNPSLIIRDANWENFHLLLERLVQSNAEILADSSLQLVAQIIRAPRGGSKRKLSTMMESEILTKKARHLYVVNNENNQLCFAINLAHLTHPDFDDRQAFTRGCEIQQAVGLTPETAIGFGDIYKFEQIVNCKIVVFYREPGNKSLSKFTTGAGNYDKTLFMLLHQNHYYGIKNISGFLGVSYVCEHCHTGYSNPGRHSCDKACAVCDNSQCADHTLALRYCQDCNRTCANEFCYQKHKERDVNSGQSRCESIKKCKKCHYVYARRNIDCEDHKCPERLCPICKVALPILDVNDGDASIYQHQCFITPLNYDPGEKSRPKIIFYDFETYADKDDDGRHKPFLVCVESYHGEKWHAFGEDCALKFLKRFRREKYKNYTFIAHNSRGFDSYLILNAMVSENLTPHLISVGSKMICITDDVFHQRYIDSLSFLPMKLADMPRALGFEEQLKGYFPHFFSAPHNLNYIGEIPPPAAYGADTMKPAERSDFLKWHSQNQNGTFNFRQEALKYCQNDTEILRKACINFRESFMAETWLDPFKSLTIAATCFRVFRTWNLTAESLAIPAVDNYRQIGKCYSSPAIQWLEWIARKNGIFIQHALNKGEKLIGSFFVDGYAEIDGVKHVYEFLGCFYHGCNQCFDSTEENPLTKQLFGEMHTSTLKRLDTLGLYNVKITSIWEHEWAALKKEADPEMAVFLDRYQTPAPVDPRSALYGGRTESFCLRYTPRCNEKISYVDVTSLYPFCMSDPKFSFPLGHPRILSADQIKNPRKYFGFISAKVYPPRKLFFPLLPFKTQSGKLLFTLCRTCGESNNQSENGCLHTDEERALTGCWPTPEFNKALELGYSVGKIFEIWHFGEKSNEIFQGYVHTFLKAKQEASGYPSGVTTAVERDNYVKESAEKHGIILNANDISFNPAKRQIAKLCLNSLWGKFAQRSNLLTCTLVREPEKFFDFMFSNKYDISYFSFLNSEIALVQWKYHKDRKYFTRPGNVNVFIAAFTTCYARLTLYEYLQQLGSRALYADTDSVVYITQDGDEFLPTGDRLGSLKDELDGAFISEWVSTGPKSYGYQTTDGKTVLKVKGITQTFKNAQVVSFDNITDLVTGYLAKENDRCLLTCHETIKRDKKGFHLKNTTVQKKFRVVYDKRQLFANGTTLPFGF